MLTMAITWKTELVDKMTTLRIEPSPIQMALQQRNFEVSIDIPILKC